MKTTKLQSLFEQTNKIIMFSSNNRSTTQFEILPYYQDEFGNWTIEGGIYNWPGSTFLTAKSAEKILNGTHTFRSGKVVKLRDEEIQFNKERDQYEKEYIKKMLEDCFF